VQHREDADGATDPLRISGERLHGCGGFAQQGRVHHARAGARHGPQLVREREGEKGVITRQEPLLRPGQPVLRPILLTLRAMPVPAGVVVILDGPTVIAPGDRAAERRRPTAREVGQGAPLRRAKSPGVRCHVRRSRRADNVRQLQHRRIRR
jgi:hypothetical protein